MRLPKSQRSNLPAGNRLRGSGLEGGVSNAKHRFRACKLGRSAAGMGKILKAAVWAKRRSRIATVP